MTNPEELTEQEKKEIFEAYEQVNRGSVHGLECILEELLNYEKNNTTKDEELNSFK